jgi:Tfp pilus assembly protein PilO
MDHTSLKDKLLNKKTSDYTFIIAFFLLFSFFVIFAIKPNLETAFRLRKELSELKSLDTNYNDAIAQIVNIQTILTEHRDDIVLLNQALPETPQLSKVISDIKTNADATGVTVRRMDVAELDLKKSKNTKIKNYILTIETSSDFPSMKAFIDGTFAQRRLKLIKLVDFDKDAAQSQAQASPPAQTTTGLHVVMQLEGYFL